MSELESLDGGSSELELEKLETELLLPSLEVDSLLVLSSDEEE